MKKTTKDFITTSLALGGGWLIVDAIVNFSAQDKELLGYGLLCSLTGYLWCLHTHSKAINNEKH